MRRVGTVILALLSTCLGSVPLETCLSPGVELAGQFVSFEVPLSYCLRDLAPDSTYELKVSYPGTQPTLFKLSLYEGEPLASRPPGHAAAAAAEDGPTGDARGRRLLDTEKVVFSTDAAGAVVLPGAASGGGGVPVSHVYLRVAAAPASPSRSLPGHPPRTGTQFNLKLDPVYAGVVPGTALPLAWFIAAALVPAAAAAVCVLLRSRTLSPFLWDPPQAAVQATAAGDYAKAR